MKLRIITASLIVLAFAACVKDRVTSSGTTVVPVVNTSGDALISYFNCNTDSVSIMFTPTSSVETGDSMFYQGAYYDTAQPGTTLNAQGMDTVLSSYSSALRLRNPAGSYILKMPTTGYRHIVLKYAVQSTSKGSKTNTITYTTDGTNYVNTALVSTFGNPANYTVDTSWSVISLDFSSDSAVNNNANFKIKIDFSNAGSTTSGNDRFDNITLWGVKE